ncbi:hypothetical protein [uncultured Kordia sp.]|uniref:hypothetical protein n=1 Tax=uncultured Kordia sp. TaxID=507699 RepID=UPI002623BC4E|nr:hypothetical protein [uncultured Kordia sp.]
MKAKTIFLIFLTFLMLGCTSEDETNNNDENPTTQNPSNENYSADGITREFSLEGIYITREDIKTDNPTVDRLIRSSVNYYYNNNLVSQDAVFVSVAGQVMNQDKDVFDLPHVTNFGYNVVTFIYGDEITNSQLTPNAILRRIESVVYSTAPGNQGTDINGQNVSKLTNGKFKIIANSTTEVLGINSQSDKVEEVTYTVSPNDFPRLQDGVLSGLNVNAPAVLIDVFNPTAAVQDIPIFIIELSNANPNLPDSNPDLTGQQMYFTRFLNN